MSWPIHWGLYLDDGSFCNTNKVALARELEKNVSPAEEIPESSATISDGMSLVQKLKGNDQTFWQLTETALSYVLHEGSKSHCTDVVFDVYRETSIKDKEQSNRGADTGIHSRTLHLGTRSSSGGSSYAVLPTKQP